MDTALAIASRRDHRRFDPRPLPDDAVAAVLDAGRLAGSARNRQPWTFFVARGPAARAALAPCVYVPSMVVAAPLAIAVGIETAGSAMAGFDAGRACQNMLLAAWDLGIASCPNGIADPERADRLLGLDGSRRTVTVLAMGYPAVPRDPARRSVAAWSAAAARRTLDEIVVDLDR